MTAPTPEQAAAYDEGRRAFAAGQPDSSVPYPTGTDARLLWVRGYVLAEAEAKHGRRPR